MKIVFILPHPIECFRAEGLDPEKFHLQRGFMHQYCRSLSRLGHETSLIYLSNETKETGVSRHIFGHRLVKVPTRGPKHLKSLVTAVRILRIREFTRSQIVHVFNYYNSLILFLGIFMKIKSKISIGNSHSNPYILGLRTKLMLWLSLRLMTHIVCLNDNEFRRVVELLNGDSKKVSIITNGVDVKAHRPSNRKEARGKLGISLNSKIILCVGVLQPRKGQHVLLQSLMKVVKKHPQTMLVLVGEGPNRNELEELTMKLDLGSHVRFTGFIPDEVLDCWYDASDIFAFPSMLESFGLVILEAMCHQLPVVNTEVGIWGEMMKKEKVGITVPKNDPEALAEAINTLFDNDDLREALGVAGRNMALKQYTWDIMGEKLEDLYSQLIREHKKIYTAA